MRRLRGCAAGYREALDVSITYVAVWDGEVCGYCRSIDDNGFYVYVCDLLVAGRFRGQDIGQSLLERLRCDHPAQLVYVMSDADGYYEKLGYHREGFSLRRRPDRDERLGSRPFGGAAGGGRSLG